MTDLNERARKIMILGATQGVEAITAELLAMVQESYMKGLKDQAAMIRQIKSEAYADAARIADGECADGIKGDNPENCLCQAHHIYRRIRARAEELK